MADKRVVGPHTDGRCTRGDCTPTGLGPASLSHTTTGLENTLARAAACKARPGNSTAYRQGPHMRHTRTPTAQRACPQHKHIAHSRPRRTALQTARAAGRMPCPQHPDQATAGATGSAGRARPGAARARARAPRRRRPPPAHARAARRLSARRACSARQCASQAPRRATGASDGQVAACAAAAAASTTPVSRAGSAAPRAAIGRGWPPRSTCAPHAGALSVAIGAPPSWLKLAAAAAWPSAFATGAGARVCVCRCDPGLATGPSWVRSEERRPSAMLPPAHAVC